MIWGDHQITTGKDSRLEYGVLFHKTALYLFRKRAPPEKALLKEPCFNDMEWQANYYMTGQRLGIRILFREKALLKEPCFHDMEWQSNHCEKRQRLGIRILFRQRALYLFRKRALLPWYGVTTQLLHDKAAIWNSYPLPHEFLLVHVLYFHIVVGHLCKKNRGIEEVYSLRLKLYFWRALLRGGGLGSRPKKMYGERLGDGVEYHFMKTTPRR